MDMEKPQAGGVIHIPAGTRYLAGNLKNNDLPMNCLFDKGKTGCGGTTIALGNDKNYIVLVPMVNLIKNKQAQAEKDSYEILGVHAGVCYEEFTDYCQRVWSKGHLENHVHLRFIYKSGKLAKIPAFQSVYQRASIGGRISHAGLLVQTETAYHARSNV